LPPADTAERDLHPASTRGLIPRGADRTKVRDMTTTDWIIDITLVLIVLRQMRAERFNLRFILLPLGIVAFTAHKYLTGLPTGGNDLALVGTCLAAGTALGLVGGMITRVFARDGHTFVQAGPGAASLWVASMGARLAFIVWITHSAGATHLAHFSKAHSITAADVWQTALVVLALSEVIVRIGTITVRAQRVSNSLAAPTATKTDKIPVSV
jgi:hypothetical protein